MTTSQETPRSAIWRRLIDEFFDDGSPSGPDQWRTVNRAMVTTLLDTALRACAEAPQPTDNKWWLQHRSTQPQPFTDQEVGEHISEINTPLRAEAPATDTGEAMTCDGCVRGLPVLVLDADGVKVEISGKPGKPSHAAGDAWWLCTTQASREDLIAENARLQSLIPACAECGEVILDNADIRCAECEDGRK